MSKTVHSVKLQAYASVDLDRISYSGGDVVYDKTNGTLRVMDGETPGGGKLATQVWVQNSAGTITANLKGDIYTAGGLRVLDNGTTLANPAFFGDIYASNGTSKILDNGTDGTNAAFTGSVTGNVTGNLTGNVTGNLTGNVTGNLTGNVTGNLTGNVTGNTDTATKLYATKTINNVAFDGSANITLGTLVNGSKTISLESDGGLRLANGSGQLYADPTDNAVYLSDSGYNTAPNANIRVGGSASIFNISFGPGATKIWTFDYNGTLTAAGDITTPNSVSADTVTTTNDVTVGGNAVISNKPTLTTHATNKQYLDKKATAMAIALS
jgi:hypothetical protein